MARYVVADPASVGGLASLGALGALVVLVGAGVWWCRLVLVDEAAYVRAVAPLGRSRWFARVAGAAVGFAVRRRVGGTPGHDALARAAATATRSVMSARCFDRAWSSANRRVHRLRRGDRRVAMLLVVLALTGRAAGLGAGSARGWRLVVRPPAGRAAR